MASRTGEAGIDVIKVLLKAGVLHDLVGQIVALAAEPVGPVHTQIGVGEKVGNILTGCRSLAELISSVQNVCPLGAVRSVRTRATNTCVLTCHSAAHNPDGTVTGQLSRSGGSATPKKK